MAPGKPKVPAFVERLTDRDRAIIRGLYESRLITLSQAADIFFGGNYEAAKKRFQKLEHAGMLAKRAGWRTYQQAIYGIRPPALRFFIKHHSEYLGDYPRLTERVARKRTYVKDSTVRHELAVMDVKAALYRGLRSIPNYTINEFITWPRLIEFEASRRSGETYTLSPDGFIELHELDADGSPQDGLDFFLEVDRSTEVRSVLTERVFGYLEYYTENKLALRFGCNPAGKERFLFHVIIVTKTEERRNSLAAHIIKHIPDLPSSFVLLTTLNEMLNTPCAPIWISTGEYYRVTRDTAFDPTMGDSDISGVYISNRRREQRVASRIRKCILWND